MKKIIFLFTLVLTCTFTFAQDFKYGIKGGFNISDFTGEDSDGTDSKLDINLGAFARFSLSDKVAFQPELVYSREGCEDDFDNKWKLNYLNIPLLLRAKMFGTDNFNLMAGPQIGFLVKSEVDTGDISADADDVLKGTNFSFVFGLDYDISEKISVGARYNLGLSKIMDGSDDFGNDLSDVKVHASTLQIGLSVCL